MELPSSTRIIQLSNELIIQEVATCLRKGQTATIRIKGNSMFPFLRHEKDAVRLQSVHPDKIRCVQIVLFKYGPVYLLHRIIRIEASQLYIRGDNRIGFPLEIVDKDAVVGYVTSIQRGTRWMPPEHFGWQLISSLWIHSYPLRLRLSSLKKHIRKILEQSNL